MRGVAWHMQQRYLAAIRYTEAFTPPFRQVNRLQAMAMASFPVIALCNEHTKHSQLYGSLGTIAMFMNNALHPTLLGNQRRGAERLHFNTPKTSVDKGLETKYRTEHRKNVVC
jgi:hypothetical protein